MEIGTNSDWTEWCAFISTEAKEEQVWLQFWLPFIKQLPMQLLSIIIIYPYHIHAAMESVENTPRETDVFAAYKVTQTVQQ